MEINAYWHHPLILRNGGAQNLIYTVSEEIPRESGCYIFYNQHGDSSFKILYIGKAANLETRLLQQFNNLRLMNGIRNSVNGNKKLIYCTVNFRRGQQRESVLEILERTLIKHAFTNGHELLNIRGTRVPHHRILFNGNRVSEQLYERVIFTPRN